ncbi:unnamed protein product [Linum trigynum]|uniref:Uncharacterized protein n=1 Tax=Linum trigynum TaxID=586398 RepID=A0AAV2FD66_9ROSI
MITIQWKGSSESRISRAARRSTVPKTARKSEFESDIETPTSSQGRRAGLLESRRVQWARLSSAAPFAKNGDGAESRNLVGSRLVSRCEIEVSPNRRSVRMEQRSAAVVIVVARLEKKRGGGIPCSQPKKTAVRIAQVPRSALTPVETRSVRLELPPSLLKNSLLEIDLETGAESAWSPCHRRDCASAKG